MGMWIKPMHSFYIRDHDREKFEERKALMEKAADFINEKYGENTIEIEIEDQYYNMADILKDHMHIVETAKEQSR